MRFCDENHDEVCYESGHDCPVCEKMKDIKKREEEIQELQEKIKELKNKVKERNYDTSDY